MDYELEDEDLLDDTMVVDDTPAAAAPVAAAPKLRSTITGAGVVDKKEKGRGFRDGMMVDREERMGDFDSLRNEGGPGPQRCIFSTKPLSQTPKSTGVTAHAGNTI